MIGRVNRWLGCGALVVASMWASSAQAQGIFGAGGYGLGFFNYGGGWGGINEPSIPFYALYPPVYYSYPVARTYGYSPFAYPPGVMTPEVAPAVGKVEVRNPFVPRPDKAQPAADLTAAGGKMIYNPFVRAAQPASGDAVAARSE